jgi:fumarylacetoacetase
MKKTVASWIPAEKDSDFPLGNLPYGIFQKPGQKPVVATRIGDTVIDLSALARNHYLDDLGFDPSCFAQPVLNSFISYGKPALQIFRARLTELFAADNPTLRDEEQPKVEILNPVRSVEMLMPVEVKDYTDFNSSMYHAENAGKLFRDPDHALPKNWRYMPIAYHGRSSSIVVSGTPIHRPKGQMRRDGALPPVFGPTRQLDFECEVGFITCKSTVLGESVSTGMAEDHIFGMVLFNDLSARDIQNWETVPLGPFLAKSFGSSISPWVVTLESLEPFRIEGPVQDPAVMPYLEFTGNHHFDINLDIILSPGGNKEYTISSSNYKYLYWNIVQQLTHQTVNGCNINVGDLYASGTISGPFPGSWGSLLEITHNGTGTLAIPDGSTRAYLEDFDTLIIRGYAKKDDLRIGFGEVSTPILPAK